MTTAHRATWTTAKGSEHQGGARLFGPSAKHSKLDANGFMTLKSRATTSLSTTTTDGADALLERDLRRELEEKEAAAREKARRGGSGEATRETLARLGEGDGDARFAPRAEDADDDASGSGSDEGSDGESESDSESDDDDDDTAALLAELERIKAERAEEARVKAAADEAAARDKRQDELATGNPLLDLSRGDRAFATKRRWDDDVVFRNQARDEPKVGKRFINDTIRSDFHKRFLNKYIK